MGILRTVGALKDSGGNKLSDIKLDLPADRLGLGQS